MNCLFIVGNVQPHITILGKGKWVVKPELFYKVLLQLTVLISSPEL